MHFNEALQKAASYCALSEKCEYDVREKLRASDVADSVIEEVISKLYRDDFINNSRFCSYYTRDKFRFNRWGKVKIQMMLRSKQLPDEEIQQALAHIDDTEYEETLFNLLQGKLKNLTYKCDYEKQGKLVRFAQSRGFEYAVISQVIKRLK